MNKKELKKELKKAGLNNIEAEIAIKLFNDNIDIDNIKNEDIITNIGDKPKFNE